MSTLVIFIKVTCTFCMSALVPLVVDFIRKVPLKGARYWALLFLGDLYHVISKRFKMS